MPTTLPDPRRSPRFAGITTFGRYPLLEHVPPAHRPLDWAIFGVPFDTGVTYRPGARFGPRAIRDASQYLKRFHLEHAIDVCDTLSLADAGDAPVNPYDCEANAQTVASFARTLADPGTRLLALGGDHSIAYANIRATHERLDSPPRGLPLIHFDAHLDTVDAVWGEKWGHASPFRRAIEAGHVDPTRMISIGIRGPFNRADDLDYARSAGATIITYDQWRTGQGAATLAAFVRALGTTPVYLTFDIDAIDPAFAPGTGTPCVGGFTSAEALAILRSLRGLNIAGADVVEVLPALDVAGNTALLAAHIAFEILALDALRKSAGV